VPAIDPQSPIDPVLAQCAEALRSGRRSVCRELLEKHPEFAAELASFMEDYDRVECRLSPWRRFSGSTPDGDAEAATLGHGDTVVPLPGPGQIFGDYELLSEVARGGMGVVFRARQRSLNRVVALKMVLGSAPGGSQGHNRFLVEARAVARLSHPNIVPIYEVNEHDGQPYFTMEFLSGGSLRERLDAIRGDQRGIARLMATVAQAVEHAHRRGILHRDLKPTNVLLDERGEPHVSDFGLAKRIGEESDLTQAGAIVGTPSYMAPEQARAETDLSTAVDVYGLGAMLYELLTGQPPFRGSTPLETMMAVVAKDPVPPRQCHSGIDADLETICLKCLAKAPLDRYGSAEALANELERWLRGEPIHARRATLVERGVKWCRRQPMLAAALSIAAVAFVGLLLLGGFLWQNAEARAQAVQNLNDAQEQLAQIGEARQQAEEKKTEAEQLAEQQRKLAEAQKTLADKIAADVRQLEKQALEAARKLADAQAEARRTTYAADMQLAQAAWQTDNVVATRDLLNRHRNPAEKEDVRGLEWHYLNRQLHAAKLSWNESTDAKGLLSVTSFSAVTGLAVSPDGKTLATAVVSGKVKLWNLTDGKLLRTLDARKANIKGMAFGNVTGIFFEDEGRKLVAVLRRDFDMKQLDKMVGAAMAKKAAFDMGMLRDALDFQVFDLEGKGDGCTEPFDPARLAGSLFPTLAGGVIVAHEGGMLVVMSMERSPDGRYLALAGMGSKVAGGDLNKPGAISGGRIIIWDLKEKRIHAQQSSPVPISAVAFAPTGPGLAVATSDGAVGLGKLDLAQPPRVMTGHQGVVHALKFSPEGSQLASGGTDGLVMLWDVAAAKEKTRYRGHASAVSRVLFQDQSLISTSLDGVIKSWDLATRQGPRVVRGHDMPIVSMAFSGKGELSTVDMGGTLKKWRLADGSSLGTIPTKQTKSLNVALSRSGKVLAWKQDFLGPVVLVRDLTSGKEQRLTWGDRLPFLLTLSPDDRWLAASDLDKTASSEKGGLVVWNLADGKIAATLDNMQGLATGLTFSPDGKLLAAAHQNGLLVWEWQTGKKRQLAAIEEKQTMMAVAISPDSKLLAAAVEEASPEGRSVTIRLWDLETGSVRNECRGAGQRINILVFSPDGQRLASAGVTSAQRGQLRLWDTSGGREVFAPAIPPALISAVAFSPDGQSLVAAVNPTDPIASISGRTVPSAIYVWDGTRLTESR
jgi:WD40 repeat protein